MHWKTLQRKIKTLSEAIQWINEQKTTGKKIVFTNGCFDLLHQGHVTYLAKAAETGDLLIVGLNSDDSVKRLEKGDERPINSESARAIVLAALGFVAAVVVFDEDTPLDLINALQPDILAKGADYDANETNPVSKKYIVGSKEVRKWNGTVVTIPLEEGFSTTSIVNKLKRSV